MHSEYGYGIRKDIEVYTQFLEGKSDEELEQISIALLGEIKENYPNDYFSSYFPHALSKEVAVSTLARKIAEERVAKASGSRRPTASDRDRELVAKDLGRVAAYSEPTPLLSVMKDAFISETKKIAVTPILKTDIEPEEIERRIKVLVTFSDEEALSRFASNSIPSSYYLSTVEQFDEECRRADQMMKKQPGTSKIQFLQRDLPIFLKVVNTFLENGIDLDTIKMNQGVSLLEVYQRIKERFGDYIQENDIIDPSKSTVENQEEASISQIDSIPSEVESTSSDIAEMVEDHSTENAQDIQDQIEANNQRILELMAENARLTASLVEIAEKEQTSSHNI